MAATDSTEIMRRTKGVYFNEDKLKRFAEVKGKTFYLKQIDATGQEYTTKYTVPNTESAFAREAVEMVLNLLEDAKEAE